MAHISRPPTPSPPQFHMRLCSPDTILAHAPVGNRHSELKAIFAHAPVDNRDSELKSLMIMAAIVSIFSVSVIMTAVYYIYLRRYSGNTHRGISRSRPFSHRAVDLFFSTSATEGLHNDILISLPVFLYKPENFSDGLKCSVCLCEFEENDKGKLLPICNHSFHVDCIDMWLFSHSTCPLCRAGVENKQSDSSSVELGERQIEVLTGEERDENATGSEEEEHGTSSAINGERVEDCSKSGTVVIDVK